MATIAVSQSAYAEIEDAFAGGTARLQQQFPTPGNCTLVLVFGPDGSVREMTCAGPCGFIDGLLGRGCGKNTPGQDGTVHVSCGCGGGWWDTIFGR